LADLLFNQPIIKTLVTIFIIFQLIGLSVISVAQSLSIVNYDSLVVGDASESNAIYAYAAIKNNTEFAIDVKVKRIDGNYNALTDDNAICWGICHLPETSESTMSIPIKAGEIDSLNFTGHVYPDKDGVPANGDITYVFFDENNPTDSVAITVHYQVVLTSSVNEDIANQDIQLFPNPANNFINLRIKPKKHQSVTFHLYDINGRKVFEEKFDGIEKINTIDLNSTKKGMYSYAVIENLKIIKTGKLLIYNKNN